MIFSGPIKITFYFIFYLLNEFYQNFNKIIRFIIKPIFKFIFRKIWPFHKNPQRHKKINKGVLQITYHPPAFIPDNNNNYSLDFKNYYQDFLAKTTIAIRIIKLIRITKIIIIIQIFIIKIIRKF